LLLAPRAPSRLFRRGRQSIPSALSASDTEWLGGPVGPFTHADRRDFPGRVDELVLGAATVVENAVVGVEDAVGELVAAHELSDIFHRVELG
jgi:hypothetical protein